MPKSPREQLVDTVSALLLSERRLEAGKAVAVFLGHKADACDTDDRAIEYCGAILHWCLNNKHYDWAAKMLWGDTVFSSEPMSTKNIWRSLDTYNTNMFMGAASMSKSYSGGVWHFLDWIRDPEWTSVYLVGPSEDHLRDNLFSHLVNLHRSASLPMPGIIGDLFIGLDTKSRKGAIRGVVIPLGKRPAGRLQGRKRVARPKAHPVFGPLSRVRIFLDELEKIPVGVWKDIDNVFSMVDHSDGFKISGAFNPEDPAGQVAIRCEPTGGWETFDPDEHHEWVSKRGWHILRLDAARSENVVQKRVVFPGLQTWEGFQQIIQNAGGIDTPGYYTMARACFPRVGAIFNVIPPMLLHKLKGEFVWQSTPVSYGACDVALEGGDAPAFAAGRYGMALGVKHPPNHEFPNGWTTYFEREDGVKFPRPALQVDQIFLLPSGDTVKMAAQIREHCLKLGIVPGHLLVDRTGNGAAALTGVAMPPASAAGRCNGTRLPCASCCVDTDWTAVFASLTRSVIPAPLLRVVGRLRISPRPAAR